MYTFGPGTRDGPDGAPLAVVPPAPSGRSRIVCAHRCGSLAASISGMSSAEHWQVQGREAELYERHLVPAVTALWAVDLVERAGVQTGDRVLDVACGTGVVTRVALERVGSQGTV